MASAAQIRAARALLGISAAELAKRADVNWKTVQRFESSDGVPPNRAGTLDRVVETLEAAGIEFVGDPVTSPGVRLRRAASSQK
jgi:DNA-binding transcriptional regulator YiaG